MKPKKRQRKLKTNLQNLNIFPNEEDKKETKNQQRTKTFGKFNIKPKLGQKRVLRNILLEAKELGKCCFLNTEEKKSCTESLGLVNDWDVNRRVAKNRTISGRK